MNTKIKMDSENIKSNMLQKEYKIISLLLSKLQKVIIKNKQFQTQREINLLKQKMTCIYVNSLLRKCFSHSKIILEFNFYQKK